MSGISLNYEYKLNSVFFLLLTLITLLVSGCTNENSENSIVIKNDKIQLPLESNILSIVFEGYDLNIDVVVDIGTAAEQTYALQNLKINQTNNTITGSFSIDLATGVHSLFLVYKIDQAGTDPIEIATSPNPIDVTIVSGQNANAKFEEALYYPDSDNDKYSNLDEVRAHSDPYNASSKPPIAPVANAGLDVNTVTGSSVQLDGSGSSDENGDVLSYSWTIKSKPTTSNATLINSNSSKPYFTPDVDGSYTIQLIVNDGTFDSALDEVVVTSETQNIPPIANAGSDQTVSLGQSVFLDGSASKDENPSVSLSFTWRFVSRPVGSTTALSNTSIVNPSFIPDREGIYELELVVNDGVYESNPDQVFVSAWINSSNFVAYYQFDNNDGVDTLGLSQLMQLQNVSFVNSTLQLNGQYQNDGSGNGYVATAYINNFSYQNFTISLDFNSNTFTGVINNFTSSNVLTGGTSYRWFGLRYNTGHLELTLNNQAYSHLFSTSSLTAGSWHNIICSFDLPNKLVRTYFDGQFLEDVVLPVDFVLDVIGSSAESTDKKFSFTNYSNGQTFNGVVDNLRVYNKTLNGSEIQNLYNNK